MDGNNKKRDEMQQSLLSMSKTGIDINLFLEAHGGFEGVEEVIRQIRSGQISGDWVVWFFPATEDTIAEAFWGPFVFKEDLYGDERFEKLRKYAIKSLKDAEALIADSVFKGDLEKICSLLLEYDEDYLLKLFGLAHQMMMWTSLTIFGHLCKGSVMDRLQRLLFGKGNPDLVTLMGLTNNKKEKQ